MGTNNLTPDSIRKAVPELRDSLIRLAKRYGSISLSFARRLLGAAVRTYRTARLLPALLGGFGRRVRRAFLARLGALRDLFRQKGLRGGMALLMAGAYARVNGKTRFAHATVMAGLLIVFILVPFWTSAFWNGGETQQKIVSATSAASSSAVSSSEPLYESHLTLALYLSFSSRTEAPSSAVSSSSSAASSQAASSASSASSKKSASSKVSKAPEKKKAAAKKKKLKSKPFSAHVSYPGDPFARPQCVWYAWGRARAVTGVSIRFRSGSHDARNWLKTVIENSHVKIVRDRSAVRANAVAVFGHSSSGGGHVLFVESVRHSSSGKPLSVTISECHWGSTTPQLRTLSWSSFRSRSGGSLLGYIYLD